MVMHLHIRPLKPALGWSRCRDANPVPTNLLADDLATAPSGPVVNPLPARPIYDRWLNHLTAPSRIRGFDFFEKH